VGGVSIRLQFNQEDRWTRAFRNLLENLAWLLAWRRATRAGGRDAVEGGGGGGEPAPR